MYKEPPIFYRFDSFKSLSKQQLLNQPPKGALSQYLGKRYPVRDLFNEDYYDNQDLFKLEFVRAFPVLPLMGSTFKVQFDKDIGKTLKNLLADKMPGIPWDIKEDWSGPFRKYQIIHGSFPAPPDEATSEPMAIELFGELIEINGEKFGSRPGNTWAKQREDRQHEIMNQLMDENRMSEMHKPDFFDLFWPAISGNMVIKIKRATYANILYPGVGVPLYS